MAKKNLKSERINVRSTKELKDLLKEISDFFGESDSETIERALELLKKNLV